MNIKTISHIAFNVTDMEQALHFYQDILGFPLLCKKIYGTALPHLKNQLQLLDSDQQESIQNMITSFEAKADEPWFIYLKIANGQCLELFYASEGDTWAIPSAGYQHLSLETDNIKAVKAHLLQNNVGLDTDIYMGPDNTYTMWISDPDGNKIEFMEYTPSSLQLSSYKEESYE